MNDSLLSDAYKQISDTVRVRIAPSPTGNLHVGTARAALFNYLFAKHHQGQFILRIEDTDQERSLDSFTQDIYTSLCGLGLRWDEGPADPGNYKTAEDTLGNYGPYKQSQRTEIYREWAQKLIAQDLAYHCYKTPEELDAERQKATDEKRPYVYERPHYTQAELAALQADPTRKPSLRFKINTSQPHVEFKDVIRGEMSFETALLGDFVIMKQDNTPTFNFANVVDDMLMKVTHVVRGEDHLPNTARHVLLYQAFGVPVPIFAHLSMILAPDRSKLSKRHGATAVSDYLAQGYLPEAFCNFLALLGWSPPDAEEFKTLDELVTQFGLERVSHSNAVFDIEKLNWMNGQYIRKLDTVTLKEKLMPYWQDAGYDLNPYTPEQQQVLVEAIQDSLVTLQDAVKEAHVFFNPSIAPEAPTLYEVMSPPESAQVLTLFRETVSQWQQDGVFASADTVAEAMKTFTKAQKPLKPKQVMWPIRLALSGETHGVDMAKLLYVLGAQEIQERLQQAQKWQVPTVSPVIGDVAANV